MYKYQALCVKVIDGDTIEAFIDLGFDLWIRKRIRLFGISAPETRTKNLEEKQFKELCQNLSIVTFVLLHLQ